MKCKNCNTENLSTAKFCNNCGEKLELQGKTCPNPECNRSGLPDEAAFCPDCGNSLKQASNSEMSSETSSSGYSHENRYNPIEYNQSHVTGHVQLKNHEYKVWLKLASKQRNRVSWLIYGWGLYWPSKIGDAIYGLYNENATTIGDFVKNVGCLILYFFYLLLFFAPFFFPLIITSPISFLLLKSFIKKQIENDLKINSWRTIASFTKAVSI